MEEKIKRLGELVLESRRLLREGLVLQLATEAAGKTAREQNTPEAWMVAAMVSTGALERVRMLKDNQKKIYEEACNLASELGVPKDMIDLFSGNMAEPQPEVDWNAKFGFPAEPKKGDA